MADPTSEVSPWPCDDYYAPLTCFTVPKGRKVPCEGCETAFPDGAQVQVMYRDNPPVLPAEVPDE